MFRTRQLSAFKIICVALFGRASWLLINEYQEESKAVLENTWKSKTVTTKFTCGFTGFAHSKVREFISKGSSC